ncbi:MAG: AAA family ATPase [Chloroflexi bacterium]|nr:AAA family ATPase [Chloroflexota bacterium]
MALKEKAATKLHLPDLQIKGFRGIDDLMIPKLGRVTLFTGKNGVGKTTVLEAVEVYAARGNSNIIDDILLRREEYTFETDIEGDPVLQINELALFHDRRLPENPAWIGGSEYDTKLIIGSNLVSLDQPMGYMELGDPGKAVAVTASIGDKQVAFFGLVDATGQLLSDAPGAGGVRRRVSPGIQGVDATPIPIACQFLHPSSVDNARLARLRDQIALTPDEGKALEALRIAYGNDIEAVTVVSEVADGWIPRTVGGRRAIVKLSGTNAPVSLKSLGEGAVRFYGTALALANCKGGFLLIDEIENGIHHSVQTDYWRMIFAAAKANDVQVLATTHSWDTVKGFAQAAVQDEESEGLAYRLERTKSGKLRAVDYTEDDLAVAVKADIELR